MKRFGPQSLALAAVLAALALLTIVTAPQPEPPPSAAYSSTTYAANGYRAWAALLAREGIATSRFVLRPIELDGRIDTLVAAQPPLLDASTRTDADIGALAAWVRGGGRLVYLGRSAPLRRAEEQLLRLPLVVPRVGARGRLRGPLAVTVRTLAQLGTSRMLVTRRDGAIDLADTNGDIVAHYPLGRGEVIAVVDPAPFANAALARADNARLAYALARPRPAGLVAFDDGLHGALIDRPWYRALPVPVRVALGFGAVALALGLIGSALRGPPPMPLVLEREPTSEEFVDALAALYERIGARETVRSILARDALDTAARSAGLPASVAPDVLLARFAERPGQAGLRRLVRALDTPVGTDADLLASAQLAYRVRKESTHGGYGDRRRAAFAGRARTSRRR